MKKNPFVQAPLLISQAALAFCLLFHVGDRQILEDAKYALIVTQALVAYVQKEREQGL